MVGLRPNEEAVGVVGGGGAVGVGSEGVGGVDGVGQEGDVADGQLQRVHLEGGRELSISQLFTTCYAHSIIHH